MNKLLRRKRKVRGTLFKQTNVAAFINSLMGGSSIGKDNSLEVCDGEESKKVD
jgi:hypothetical protein